MCCAFHIQFTQRLRTCTAPSTTRHISPKWIPSPPLSCISTTAFSAWQANGADAQGLMQARTRARCLFLWKRGICVKRIFNNLNKKKKPERKRKRGYNSDCVSWKVRNKCQLWNYWECFSQDDLIVTFHPVRMMVDYAESVSCAFVGKTVEILRLFDCTLVKKKYFLLVKLNCWSVTTYEQNTHQARLFKSTVYKIT